MVTNVLQDARHGRAGPSGHGLFRGLGTLFLALVVGCSPDRQRAGWRGSIDTLPNGGVVVRNEAGQVWDSTTAWRLVEDLRIGNADGEGPAGFAQIAALETDGLGRLYVLEGQAQQVRVFDATGAYVRAIGRNGSGPGEFRQAMGMAWDPHDRLWIVDQQNVRYTLVDTSGKVVATRPRPFSGWFTWRWQGGIDDVGRLYEWYRVPGAMGGDRLLRYDSTLRSADTFPVPSYEGELYKIEQQNMRSYASVPFTPSLVWTFDPRGYVWFGVTAPYRIFRRALKGDTSLVVEQAYQPLPVTPSQRDSALARYDWFVKQGGKLDPSRVPDRKPAFERFTIDDAGALWVTPVVDGDGKGRTLDVFDPGGRYLGRVVAPFSIFANGPLLIRGDRLYAVTTDVDGVPYVVRARIERRSPRP